MPNHEQAAVLTATSLTKSFSGREALRGVDLEVGSGEVVAVIGPNGAGKTTLLSILAGITSATPDPVSAGSRSRPRSIAG